MRTITQYLLLCCAALASGCSQQPAPTPAETLEARLRNCVEHGLVLFGHQDDLFYGKHWNRWDSGCEQSDIRAVAGDYPAILGVEIGGIELGDSLSLDRRYLPRLFRKEYGETLSRYLIRVRMEHAAAYIRQGYTAEEAGRLSGYEDPANFYRMFKRWYGVGPAAYRRKKQTAEAEKNDGLSEGEEGRA